MGFPEWSVVKKPPASACHGTGKPVYRNYWARSVEPRICKYGSLRALEPMLHDKRIHCKEKLPHFK